MVERQDCPVSPPGSNMQKYEEFQNETLAEDENTHNARHIMSDPNMDRATAFYSQGHNDVQERGSAPILPEYDPKNLRSSIN